jgi:hypothetical protein
MMRPNVELPAAHAPLCPVGHLPHKGGDRPRHGFRFSFNGASKRESGDAAISPLAGEMLTGRGGRLAPILKGTTA